MVEIQIGTDLASLDFKDVKEWFAEKEAEVKSKDSAMEKLELMDDVYLQVQVYVGFRELGSNMTGPVIVGEDLLAIRNWITGDRKSE